MARKIKGDDGKIYVEQQPFYKRGWFWVLVVVAIILIFGMVSLKSNKTSTAKHPETAKKATPKYYKVGDTVKVGKVTYTLKSVELTEERNEFEDSQPKYVVKVIYHIKNNSDKDIPIGTDMTAYGPNNNKLKSYPVSDITLDSVAAGKEADVTDGFGTDKLGTFELQFVPTISTEKPAKFKVKIKNKKSNSSVLSSQSSQATGNTANNPVTKDSQSSVSDESSNSDPRTGDWHHDPDLWASVHNDENYKGSIYENTPPQMRYNYLEDQVHRWDSVPMSQGGNAPD